MKENKKNSAHSQEIAKVESRIKGLDIVLNGGFGKGRVTVVLGGPGCGKSVMGLEFIYRNALAGEPGIYITFEERAEAVRKNAASLGWDLAPLEKNNTFFLLEARLDPSTVFSGNFNIEGLLTMIEAKAENMGAKRICVDAVDALMRHYQDPQEEYMALYNLHEWLLNHEMTSLLTLKGTINDTSNRHQYLDYMSDCVIGLDQRLLEQVSTRRLRVLKYRGTNFVRNEHPFSISIDGMQIIASASAELNYPASTEAVSSGNKVLDQMLVGGYKKGSTILYTGTSGTGKSTLAATFTAQASLRKERTLYINFEESQEMMIANMLSPGIDLQPGVRDDSLRFLCVLPESSGIEEHLVRTFTAIDDFAPHHLIVDAISACDRMGGENAAFDYLFRLLHHCKEQGITCILINQLMGGDTMESFSGIGISSMVDTVIFIRYLENGGEINRTLTVVKARGIGHSNQTREYLITSAGIDIQDIYIGQGGVLTGSARQEQEEKDNIEAERLRAELLASQEMIKQKEALLVSEQKRLEADVIVARTQMKVLELAQQVRNLGRNARGDLRSDEKTQSPDTPQVHKKKTKAKGAK